MKSISLLFFLSFSLFCNSHYKDIPIIYEGKIKVQRIYVYKHLANFRVEDLGEVNLYEGSSCDECDAGFELYISIPSNNYYIPSKAYSISYLPGTEYNPFEKYIALKVRVFYGILKGATGVYIYINDVQKNTHKVNSIEFGNKKILFKSNNTKDLIKELEVQLKKKKVSELEGSLSHTPP